MSRWRKQSERLRTAGAAGASQLLASSHVTCPAIWCWGRRPVIVLPKTQGDRSVDWMACFATAGAAGAPRPRLEPARRGLGLCPAIPAAGLVGPHSAGSTERAGVRRLGHCRRTRSGGLRGDTASTPARRSTLSALAAVSRRSGLSARSALARTRWPCRASAWPSVERRLSALAAIGLSP